MFGFFKSSVEENNVKKYKSATRAIKIYISLSMYEKAIKACNEIITKEKDSLANFIRKISHERNSEKLIKKESRIFEHRQTEITKLKNKAQILHRKKVEKEEKKRFKKKFIELRKELRNKIKLGKGLEAMSKLKYFLSTNKNRVEVVNFYNSEKKVIQKALEKQQQKIKNDLKSNTQAEAMSLIGKEYTPKVEEVKEKKSFFQKIFHNIFGIDKLRKKIEEEKLVDEVNKLLADNDKKIDDNVKGKIETMHKGLVKELKYNTIAGYDMYGKILGADKISGDTFGMNETVKDYKIFFGDATGHGIRAGFIVTLLNKGFRKFRDLPLIDMAFEINNSLKQNLESRNFITGALIQVKKSDYEISYVGMGHEPVFIFRNKDKKVEKKVLGGLAGGIRIMKDKKNVLERTLKMEHGDIFMIYSDGIVEAKNDSGEFYGFDRLQTNFQLISQSEHNLQKIYDFIMNDLKLFRGGSRFDDDSSILLIKRDKTKERVREDDNFIEDIKQREHLTEKEGKTLQGKTKAEIRKKVAEIQKKKDTERIIRILKESYNNGEILKLKQDAVRYVKEGYVDKRINFYLKKALKNEKKYKIEQKNNKMMNKYKVLEELYKKGNYDTVIKEAEEIIAKDGGF